MSFPADWDSFLQGVDATKPAPDVLAAAKALLVTKGKLASPAMLDGLDLDNIKSMDGYAEVELPTKSFLARVMRATIAITKAIEAAKTPPVTALVSSPGSTGTTAGPSTAMLNQLMGGSESALKVAAALAGGQKAVDIDEKLKAAHLGQLDFHLKAEAVMWNLLATENAAAGAAVPPRVAFTYVDFTAKEMLPMWIAPDAVGGKMLLPGEGDALAADYSNSSAIGALGAALKSASSSPRFFRSLLQWSTVYWRYAPMAIAMGQLTWNGVLGHYNTIMRLAEECKLDQDGQFLPMLYDDLLRKQMASRAEARDPLLMVEAELQKPNKAVLTAARTRLGTVVAAAGLKKAAPMSTPPQFAASMEQSVVAKQQAALAAATRQANDAQKALQQQQKQFDTRSSALHQKGYPAAADRRPPQPPPPPGGGYKSKKQQKTEIWHAKAMDGRMQREAKRQRKQW